MIDSNNDENLIKNQNYLEDNIFEYLSFLHSQSLLSRSIIHEIFDITKKQLIEPILEMNFDEKVKNDVEEVFKKFNTYYKFKKELKKRNKIVEPIHRVISEKIALKFKNGKPVYESVEEKVSLMPIKQSMKAFLEISDIFTSITKNIQELEADSQGEMKNFVQGKLWKDIKSQYQDNQIVIPCFLYHDDFEADNPLGSNAGANKIAAFYFSFPTIPQHLTSSPKYIFDCMLFHSGLKTENLEQAMEPIIEEFKDLETDGLLLNFDGKEIKVHIILCLLIGDNLAQNELLGYSKSFNAKFYCRFCKMPKHLAKNTTLIDQKYLRNTSSYDNDLEEKKDGTMRYCCLNKLRFFHATKNYSCDIMHDIYEGIARYDLAMFLNYAIYEKKFIDLWTLNKLKQEFDYGSIEIGNMGPEILDTQIKNNCLMMSASEMRNFLHFLPLMIGHKIKGEDERKKWSVILQLVEISEILMQSIISRDDLNYLDELIQTFLSNRSEQFNQPMKPKHHLMLHYKLCIENSGPLRNLMCFSFEQMNRIVKRYGKVSFQRIDLSWSLLSKRIMHHNKFIDEHKNGFPEEFEIIQKKIEKTTIQIMKTKKYYSDDLFDETDEIYLFDGIKYKGTYFRKGYYIATQDAKLQFYLILDIIKKNDIFYFALDEIKIINYDKHKLCYNVGKCFNNYKLSLIHELKFYPFNLHKTVDGNSSVRLKKI